MGIWDTIKSWAKSVWRWVKNVFSWDTYTDTVKDDTTQDTWKQTLNQQIASWNINTNKNNAQQIERNTPTLDLTPEQQTPTLKQETAESVINEDRQEDSFLSTLWNWFSSASKDIVDIAWDINDWWNDTINSLINSRRQKAEYNQLEETYAVWYNPDNRNVYYLDLNEDRWFFDWDFGTHEWVRDEFESLLNDTYTKMETPGITQAEKTQTWMDFYNNAKHLFRIRADDRYTDGLFWKTAYWRRDEMYTQEELDMLANSGKTEKRRYEPTPEEFEDFVNMYLRNSETQRQLWIQYTPAEKQAEVLELWNAQSDWMPGRTQIAMNNVDSYFSPMKTVNPDAATDALLTYKSSVLQSQLWRRYNYVAPLYRAETEILNRDSTTWSEYDKQTLRAAEVARQMDDAYARNINDLLRQTLLYWTNKKWDIVNTPDTFENWESLNDVLTKDLREIAWFDRSRYAEHQSPLDIIEKFTNNALYNYRKDKDGPIKKGWNTLEHWLAPVGTTLWEAGQAAWAFWIDSVWALSMGTLYDWLTKEYMDQDSTVWRLMETDDNNMGRTIKKYYLDVTEYTPEIIWNLAPDIALYAATGPGGLTTTARYIWNVTRAYKLTKAAEWASMLNKLKVITWMARWEKAAEALWMSRKVYTEIINATKNAPKIKNYQTLKTAGELVDRMVTQVWLWQFMDWQWSAYDTEPYSQASFLMSVIGSVAFDFMPDFVRATTWRGWWSLLSGRYWDSIWSLARYIDSSEEAANNVARALRKGTWEISVDDLKTFAKNYSAIEEAAKKVYNEQLTPEQKQAIGKMTKNLVYSYVNQAFWANSTIGKSVRRMLQSEKTNVADMIKYLGNVPWTVEVWPFVSNIRLKNWTRAAALVKNSTWEYDPVLDSIFDWGFDSRVRKWFSQADIEKLAETKWYSWIEKNKWRYFYSVTDDKGIPTYYLTQEWLNRFGLKAESLTLESLWVSLKESENTMEALNAIKWVEGVKISPETVDALAMTGWYDEITSKVKEVLWC